MLLSISATTSITLTVSLINLTSTVTSQFHCLNFSAQLNYNGGYTDGLLLGT